MALTYAAAGIAISSWHSPWAFGGATISLGAMTVSIYHRYAAAQANGPRTNIPGCAHEACREPGPSVPRGAPGRLVPVIANPAPCVIPVKSCIDGAGTFRKENMRAERAKHLKIGGNIMFGKHRDGLA